MREIQIATSLRERVFCKSKVTEKPMSGCKIDKLMSKIEAKYIVSRGKSSSRKMMMILASTSAASATTREEMERLYATQMSLVVFCFTILALRIMSACLCASG